MAESRITRGDSTAALIFALSWAAVLYAGVAGNPLVYEDDTLHNPIAWRLPGRALMMLSVAHQSPAAMHLGNLALHLANGLLLAIAVAGVWTPIVAAAAAGVFLLLPLNSEAVLYASARGDLLVTFWTLSGAALLVRGQAPRLSPTRLTLMALAVVAAAASKEVGVIAGPLLLMTAALLRPGLLQRSLGAVFPLASGLVGVAVGLVLRDIWTWMHGITPERLLLPIAQFLTVQAAGLWRLLALFVWPTGLAFDHDPWALGLAWRIAGVVGSVSAVVIAVAFARRSPRVAWCLGWVAIAVAPRFLTQTSEWIHEYQFYPASVGLCVVAGVLVISFAEWITPERIALSWPT